MPQRIPQSIALRVPLKAYLTSDHVSDATGKTIVITISKNGAAFGNPSAGATNATEIGNGWYYVDLSVTDTGTLGPVVIRGAVATVDNVEIVYQVVDATNMGASNLDAAVSSRSTYAGADTAGITTLLTRIPGTVTAQTGDAYARIGAAGAGLTALGDARLANLDAAVSSRTKPADTQAAVTNLTNAPTAGDFTAAMKTSLSAATPAVTVSDKTGFSLATAPPTAAQVRTEMDANSTKLANLDATVSSRSTFAGGAVASVTAGVTLDATYQATLVAAVWAAATRTLSSFGTLAADAATAVWAAATRTLSAFGFTVASTADPNVALIKAKTDNLPATPAAVGSAMTLTVAYDAAKTANATAPDNAGIASIESMLATLPVPNNAGIAAIKAKTDNLPADPAAVSDLPPAPDNAGIAAIEATLAGLPLPDNTDIAAIKAKTDNLPAAPAAVGSAMTLTGAYDAAKTANATAPDNAGIATIEALVGAIPTANENADALLKRDWSALSGEAAFSALNALRNMRNHVTITGSVVSVYKEDGSTVAYTLAITTDPSQDPIVAVTP